MDPRQVILGRPAFRREVGEGAGPVDNWEVDKGGVGAGELGAGRKEGLGRASYDQAMSRLYPSLAEVCLAVGDVEPARPRHDAEVVEGALG